jgi:hypothetical protein
MGFFKLWAPFAADQLSGPDRRTTPPNSRPDMLRCLTTISQFVAIVVRMGLWPLLEREFASTGLLMTWLYGSQKSIDDEVDTLIRHLLFEPLYDRYYPRYAFQITTLPLPDPFDILAALPVPPYTVPFAVRSGQNLQTLLSRVAATPAELLDVSDRQIGLETAELVIFGAACLNLGSESCPTDWVLQLDIYEQFADRLVAQALAWLGTVFPKLVYTTEVEGIIGQASKVPA